MSRRFNTLIVFALAMCTLGSLLAQTDPVQQEKWKNGFLATGTYDSVAPGTVNLHNGGLILSIPLFSLKGRAGQDLNVGATYNSKQLVRYYDGSQWVADYFYDGPTVGRWVVNLFPALRTAALNNPPYYFSSVTFFL